MAKKVFYHVIYVHPANKTVHSAILRSTNQASACASLEFFLIKAKQTDFAPLQIYSVDRIFMQHNEIIYAETMHMADAPQIINRNMVGQLLTVDEVEQLHADLSDDEGVFRGAINAKLRQS